MRKTITTTALFCCFVLSNLCNADRIPYQQPDNPNRLTERWRWTELEALKGSAFTCAAEDVNEVLWFADQNGLSSYDGLTIETYPAPGGRFSANPSTLYIANDQTIYLGGRNELWSFKDNAWKVALHYEDNFWGKQNILELADGSLLVGAPQGLYRIFRNGEVTRLFDADSAICGLIKHDGAIWFSESHSRNLYKCPLADGEPVSPENWTYYTVPGRNAKPRYIAADREGRLWCTSSDASFSALRYNKEEDEWEKVDFGVPTGSFRYQERWITQCHDGNLAIRTIDGLICQVGEEWLSLDNTEFDLPTTVPFVVLRKNGNTIIGSQRSSIYEVQTSGKSWKTYSELNFQFESQTGDLWFIDQQGQVVQHSPEEESWHTYNGCIDTPTGLMETSDLTIWAYGSDRSQAAVARLHEESWSIRRYPQLGPRICYLSSHSSDDGKLYFGSGRLPEETRVNSQGGLLQLDIINGNVQERFIREDPMPVRTYGIAQTPDGSLWVGGQGLTKVETPNTQQRILFPDTFAGQWIDHVICDSRGRLWIALWGIGVYLLEDGAWTLFDYSSGLSTNNVVFLIEHKQQPGVILAATETGIARFIDGKWTHRPLPEELHIPRENCTLKQSSDGSLWINALTKPWYNRTSSTLLTETTQPPSIRSIRYSPETEEPTTTITNYQEEIPEPGNAYISWSGLDSWGQTPNSFLEYSTRINSGSWSPYSNDTDILATSLQAGEYTFEVRARDFDGNVQSAPSSITFMVTAPIWKRPWFQALVLATVLFIAYLITHIIRLRIRHIREIEEIKINFFTNISHELRTPLTVISGPLESALEAVKEGKVKEQIALALKGAKKTMHLVDQLLDFRKYESAHWPSRLVQGDISKYVREAVSLHKALAQQKGQTLEFESNIGLTNTQYDEEKLPKIVDNLVSNASKYTPSGGTISVLIRDDLLPEHISIQVEDTGQGVPVSDQANIFEPFNRSSSKVRLREKGTGLGLPLTRSLVHSLNGTIELVSPVANGRGTRFTVHLPIVFVESETPIQPLPEVTNQAGDKRRVLIVEDDSDIRNFLRIELSEKYHILEATDGKQALEIAKEEHPDLVITDVMMPVMDGRELCAKLKSDEGTNHIPVIMLTALSSDAEKLRGLEASADDYITKPIKPAYLKLKVQNRFETRDRHIKRYRKEFLKPETPIKRPGNKGQREEFVEKAMTLIAEHLADPEFDVQRLSDAMSMSRFTLYRKLKAMTGETPNVMIQKLRMKRAAELLLEDHNTISEIVDLVGFRELSYFSSSFKKHYHCKPSEYKTMYEQEKEKAKLS